MNSGSTKEQKRDAATAVLEKLKRAGHAAYIVGGAVRDHLMGREPEDYDIATSAVPEQVEGLFERTHSVGKSFGVVLVLMGSVSIEVATFRRDLGYSDGRRPDAVVFTDDPAEDAARRDFTINALMWDPISDEVLDTVGGRKDIEDRLIRTVGVPAHRFEEDRLRMLRAVRFSAVLGFEIEKDTAEAIRKLASKVTVVSRERIRDELLKMLLAPKPSRGIELMSELGLLVHVLPELEKTKGVLQPEQFHPEGDVYRHSLMTLDQIGPKDPILRLAALLHDCGKPDTMTREDRIRFNEHDRKGREIVFKTARRLRLSKHEGERLALLVGRHMRIADAPKMREAKLIRMLSEPDFPDLLELHKADCMASHKNLVVYDFCNRKKAMLDAMPKPPEPLLSGRDLIEIGLQPGPIFGRILKEVENARLEGRVENKTQALDLARKLASKSPYDSEENSNGSENT